MTKDNIKIVYIREGVFTSIVSDIFTFGIMVFSFWFNYNFINGNNFLDLLLFICFFLFGIGRAGNVKHYLEQNKKIKEL